MRYINGEVYLSPSEAGAKIGVSYKTIQRWVDAGVMHCWRKVDGKRQKVVLTVSVTPHFTVTGYRLYKESDIKALHTQITESIGSDKPLNSLISNAVEADTTAT